MPPQRKPELVMSKHTGANEDTLPEQKAPKTKLFMQYLSRSHALALLMRDRLTLANRIANEDPKKPIKGYDTESERLVENRRYRFG